MPGVSSELDLVTLSQDREIDFRFLNPMQFLAMSMQYLLAGKVNF